MCAEACAKQHRLLLQPELRSSGPTQGQAGGLGAPKHRPQPTLRHRAQPVPYNPLALPSTQHTALSHSLLPLSKTKAQGMAVSLRLAPKQPQTRCTFFSDGQKFQQEPSPRAVDLHPLHLQAAKKRSSGWKGQQSTALPQNSQAGMAINSQAGMAISSHRSKLLSRKGTEGFLPQCAARGQAGAGSRSRWDARWTRPWGGMRSAAEVSSNGKLFREIKKQVGNRAAKQTVQETIALLIGFQTPPLLPRRCQEYGFGPVILEGFSTLRHARRRCRLLTLLPFLFQGPTDFCWEVTGRVLQVSVDKSVNSPSKTRCNPELSSRERQIGLRRHGSLVIHPFLTSVSPAK